MTRLHCAGTEEYYRSTGEAVMVQKVLWEHSGGCAGTVEN